MPFTYEFPRPALTVDVIVVTAESTQRILLIRRGEEPCAGMWALPGGFVNENEPLEQAARRELREETGIVIDELHQVGSFGDPGRDPRGWTVSVVFLSSLVGSIPNPLGADDADAAAWFPLDQLPRLAFDHAKIIASALSHVK